MTKDQRHQLAMWALPILFGAAVSIGVAQAQLSGKEDKADHDRDIARLESAEAVRAVRDSAALAQIRSMLRDIACPANPTRDYCR